MTDIPAWALPRPSLRPWSQTRTAHPPGIGPLEPSEWLLRDAAYAAQMALRDDLAETKHAEIVRCLPEGEAAAAELRAMLTEEVLARHDARIEGEALIRADGVAVPLSLPDMAFVNRIAPEDFLILDKPDGAAEHVLVAGALAFPSYWTLAEKIGRALMRIHVPVVEYDAALGARVQRLHDGVRPGKPLIRANWNFADKPDLHVPGREADKKQRRRDRADPADWTGAWLRVERQTLTRLPRSGAVVFGIHTLISPLTGFDDQDWRDLHRALEELPEHARADKAGHAIIAEAARRAAL